jgi:hypothetical protein
VEAAVLAELWAEPLAGVAGDRQSCGRRRDEPCGERKAPPPATPADDADDADAARKADGPDMTPLGKPLARPLYEPLREPLMWPKPAESSPRKAAKVGFMGGEAR